MKTQFDFNGKKAVVTGGGSGIGKAICLALAACGAHVIIVDRDESGADAVAVEIKKNQGKALKRICDISDEEAVHAAFGSDQIDILVNNAAIAHIGNLTATSEEDFQRVYDINVKGTYNCLKAGVNLMLATGGAIVNISSIAAHVGIQDRFAYSMSKGAVHAMTLSVAKDYLHQSIRCNSISPARIRTPFVDGFIKRNYPGQEREMHDKLSQSQPVGRMGKPEEVASMVLYLCSGHADFITGTDFPIDGGFITLNN